ncbi:hypothetical protein DRF65_08585 [Chryseobacterium pennae]|uniref:Uncharacterized protein n=1 Tax=Chryseobacterium pennae TaxID=2258962 RepID=A0A3D9CAW7_9FLAO|nr:hypothetical protein DRF65_08585 [Chryseobacterium pennae]
MNICISNSSLRKTFQLCTKRTEIRNKEISNSGATRVVLENAASISGMLLTTECVTIEVKSAGPAMPMGLECQE